jgi:hypothetical protein
MIPRHKPLAEKVREVLLQLMLTRSRSSAMRKPTVGVEHEFFLLGASGEPATLPESQKFLAALSREPHWRVYKQTAPTEGESLITRVSRESGNKYSTVKYEFPPHMLEIAFSYHSSLAELKSEIQAVWSSILSAQKMSGMRVLSVSKIHPPKLDRNEQALIDSDYLALSDTRRAMFARRSESVNEKIVDFPSYMAATQIHVGGLAWWDQPNLLPHLYSIETAIQAYSYDLSSEVNPAALSAVRWQAYSGVFKGLPLLGFPDMPSWTLDNWVEAMCDSVLVNADETGYTKSLRDFPVDCSLTEVLAFLPKVRDLQIIKPKLIGTLEFRADPAVRGPQFMVDLAAIRLGQCLLARTRMSKPAPNDFRHERERWWSNIGQMNKGSDCETTLSNIADELRKTEPEYRAGKGTSVA